MSVLEIIGWFAAGFALIGFIALVVLIVWIQYSRPEDWQ